MYLLIAGDRGFFSIFIMISLVTDFLDGLFARMLNQKTAIGAKLDSIADLGTFILAISGLFRFESEFLSAHSILMISYVCLYLLCPVIGFVKYKKLTSFHIYAFKITAYIQAIFLLVLFSYGYSPWAFYPALWIGIYSCLEELIIIFLLPEPISDVKGLFWVLKSRTAGLK